MSAFVGRVGRVPRRAVVPLVIPQVQEREQSYKEYHGAESSPHVPGQMPEDGGGTHCGSQHAEISHGAGVPRLVPHRKAFVRVLSQIFI